MPAAVWFGRGGKIEESIKYRYDTCGNICEISENGHVIAKYTYDSLNRLIREDNRAIGKTVLFAYDNAGNITERCEYAYTRKSGEELTEQQCTHFSYDYEGDKLVSYNGGTFEYNSIGNPATYRGKSCQWQYGTRLISFGSTGFGYDGLGRRTRKGNVTFTYDDGGRLLKQSNGLEFVYDASGISAVIYGNQTYFYRKDAQGNVVAILNGSGGLVAKYIYDAWGNHAVVDANGRDLTGGIGVLNPFRYRSYYYDTETELYFLQTRYYDPEVGRFISQDGIEFADHKSINGLNLYAYCANNPVMFVDPTGTMPQWLRKLIDWSSTILGLLNPVSKVVAAVDLVVAAIQGRGADIREDWNNGCFNPFNMDENVALNSKVFSFYKGESVIRHNIPNQMKELTFQCHGKERRTGLVE